MQVHRPTLAAIAAAFALPACGGDGDSPPMASQGALAFQSATPGATPFLGRLQVNGVDWQNVSAVAFTVANKTGAVSRPVHVRYEAAALLRKGFEGSAVVGTVKSTTVNNFHHNVDLAKTGFLAEFDTTIAGVKHVESQVGEIDTTGAVLQEWDFAKILSDYMTAEGDEPSLFIRPGIDWFHVNSSIYDPRDDSVIVSSRENFVIKLDYKTGKPLWILGDPLKYWYTFPSLRKLALTLDAGGLYPIGQHALSITSDGSLMLFDNGANSLNQPSGAPTGMTRAYSAVSKFTIDATNRLATMNWRFDNAKSIQSSYCSSAYEVSNKTMLVTYAIADGNSARLIGLGTDQKIAFDFNYPSLRCDTAWNALPIAFDALQYR
ncbi:MAG: hypothetical protein EKK52_06010 [Burkholderiales bacterium]|uniref:aryl-sulfate sulfotransferase n=1 Tax=Roseateles sp. TaxID=1971397 RepID=UPI000FB8BE8D|nr:MAG: hypothetical protein EKK52_06010 [Burkholderiales bacterium]